MIDASSFASSYNAFWNEASPTLEHFVRRMNVGRLERFDIPMVESKTTRRAVIAEYAFSVFFERWKDAGVKLSDEQIEEGAWKQMTRRLKPFLGQGVDLETRLIESEKAEADEISKRLQNFFRITLHPDNVRPIISGCGFVDASEADVFADKTLFEVKTVDRSFRSSDLRQLIAYAALNHSSKQFEIEKIGLLNPRMGQYFVLTIEDLSIEISGRPAEELLSMIVQTISSGEISR